MTWNLWWRAAALMVGYGLASLGHFFFDAFYSFIGDWVMWRDMLTRRIRF